MRSSTTFFIGTIFFAGLTASCGKSNKTSSLKGDVQSLLIVASGGFSSCGRGGAEAPNDPRKTALVPFVENLAKTARASGVAKVATAVTCFSQRLIAPTDTIFYVLSSAPSVVRSGSRQEFNQALAAITAEEPSTRTMLIGHSYGGWSVLQQALNLDSRVQITSLTTIDPISAVNCKPVTFLFGDGTSTNTEPGCQTAPADLTAAERLQIKRRVPIWNNYFQTDFQLLHSSAMPEASANTKLNFSNTPLRAHTAIQSDAVIWRELENQIAQASRESASRLFLALGNETAGETTLFATASKNISQIRLCSDLPCSIANSALEFTLHEKQPFSDRNVFRGTARLKILPDLTYTLAGSSSGGETIGAIKVTFARP
jgi:pimeloyl-ACP methyl ester carboxylesterase